MTILEKILLIGMGAYCAFCFVIFLLTRWLKKKMGCDTMEEAPYYYIYKGEAWYEKPKTLRDHLAVYLINSSFLNWCHNYAGFGGIMSVVFIVASFIAICTMFGS